MPNPDNKTKITIQRPDGSTFEGTPDELKKLQLIGDYKQSTVDDRLLDLRDEADVRAYSTGAEQLKTLGEGILSGATLGAADPLLTDTSTSLRAEANPGTRLGGEILGGIGAAFVPGGQFTPAGAVSKLATGAGKAVGGGFKGAAVAGAAEGAAAGIQAEISNATLSNDPVTAQRVLSGIGYGALFGAGLNAAVHGAGRGLERAGKRLEVKPPEPMYVPKQKTPGEIELVTPEKYDAFRQSIVDTRDGLVPNPEYSTRLAEIKNLQDDMAKIDSAFKESGTATQADLANWQQKNARLQELQQSLPPENITPFDAVNGYISKLDEEAATMQKQYADSLAELDVQIATAKRNANDIAKNKIPNAQKEHTDELIKVNNDIKFAERELDKFNKEAQEAVELSQEQYRAEVKSGGLYQSRKGIEEAYNRLIEKVSFADNELYSEYSTAIKKGLAKYDKLVKAGDFAQAKKLLTTTRNGLESLVKAVKQDIEVPVVKLGIKADPAKVAEIYTKISTFEEKLGGATKRLDELKARGVPDYGPQLKSAEDEVNALLQLKKRSPKTLDTTEFEESKKGLLEIQGALNHVRNVPATAGEFMKMGTKSMNNLMDSIDTVIKARDLMPELAPVVDSLERAVKSLVDSTDIKVGGGLTNQLRAIHKIAKEANKQDLFGPIEHAVIDAKTAKTHGRAGLFDDAGAYLGASALSRATGTGTPGYFGFKHLLLGSIDNLAGIKSAVQQRVSKAAKSVGKTFQSTKKNYVVPKLEPLYTKLNGERDKDSKNHREAAKNRINEVMELAPVVNDTLYRALEPLAGSLHNDLIATMHAEALKGFDAFIELLPKDRLGTTNAFKQTWEPNDYETVITAKLFEVFTNPFQTIEEATSGAVDAMKVKALEKIWPHLYTQLQSEVMDTISSGSSMLLNSFNNQQMLSTLLGIKVSSAFKPENVVDAQAIFVATPEVSNPNKVGGGNRNNAGGGRSAEPATPAQSNISRY